MWSRKLEDTSKLKNLFQLISPEKTWTFFTTTPAEREVWLQEITRQDNI